MGIPQKLCRSRFLKARPKSLEKDVLMPISPNEEPTGREGLSRDGETADDMDEVGKEI